MSTPALSFQSLVKLNSGHSIQRLGFGVAFGFGKSEDSDSISAPSVLEALKVGYRHVDSAQMYRNERHVGEAIRASGIAREELFITSKVPSYGNAASAVNASLKAFGFDYLDLFLIHSAPQGTRARLKMWGDLLKAKEEGKIRSAGVSNFAVRHLEEIKGAGLELPAVNQIELHPLCQQRPIVEYCKANGIAVEAYCPVIRGQLENPVFVQIAKKHDRDTAQILLRWNLQKGNIVLVRSSNPARILSNSQLYDFELDEDDMSKLDALDRGAAGAISWNPVDTP